MKLAPLWLPGSRNNIFGGIVAVLIAAYRGNGSGLISASQRRSRASLYQEAEADAGDGEILGLSNSFYSFKKMITASGKLQALLRDDHCRPNDRYSRPKNLMLGQLNPMLDPLNYMWLPSSRVFYPLRI